MKKKHCIYALFLIIGFSCKTIVTTPQKFEGDQIAFGNGGGFTGAVTTYVLLENGQIFIKNSLKEEEWSEHRILTRKLTKSLIQEAEMSGLLEIDHDHPGNTYKFIRANIDGQEYYTCWGASDHPIPEAISSYYFELMEIVKPD